MESGEEAAPPQETQVAPIALSARTRFLLGHITPIGLIGFFTLCGIAVAPSMFQAGPAATQELQGHLSGAHMTPGKTKLENVFEFTVKEMPQVFVATGLREIDQMVFTSEKNGAFLQFEVESAKVGAGEKKISVHTLKSLKNVYLGGGPGNELAKSKLIAVSFFFIFFGIAGFFLLRLRNKFKKLTPETAQTLKLDPLVSGGLDHPYVFGAIPFLGAYIVVLLLTGSQGWFLSLVSITAGYGVFAAWFMVKGRKLSVMTGLKALHTQTTAYTGERIKTEKPTHLKAVEFLVRAGKLDVHGPDGKTPLIMAVEKTQWDAAEALIRVGANVDLQTQEGTTALMLAAEAAQTPLVTKLVQAGASVLLKNAKGLTALEIAKTKDKNQPVIELLTKTSQAQTQLFTAIAESKLDPLSRALATGAKASVLNSNRQSALSLAIAGKFADGVKRLVAAGANVDEALAQAGQASGNVEIQRVISEAWLKVQNQNAQKQRAAAALKSS